MPGPGPLLAMSVKTEKLDDTGGREKSSGTGEGLLGGLDAQLWHACAGGMVQLPPVGAKIIYFPQGHGEQAATTPEFPRSLGPTGTIPCRVVSVNFMADTETDEVFARLRLQPEGSSYSRDLMDDSPPSPPPEKPASFAKTLTQSDANNGGGFSVPRYCAETIFPPLDYSTDPPVQTVLAKDVHGDTWKFRHIYRGTPRRHLLTTGWSTFVNQKKLVAGDAIVFLRSASGELCVGVRRSMRGASGGDSSSWHSSASGSSGAIRTSRWEVKGTESFSDFLGGGGDSGHGGTNTSVRSGNQGSSTSSSFARNRARVTAKSVLEAASLAVAGKPFEVVYYPRASTAEFCVKAALVKQALEHTWYSGMRFKMAFETEDSSRISWFMGTIAAVQSADPLLWPNSPWRVLQVTWDEPDLLQGVTRVSPWQVELVATLPMQLPPFSLPKKKLRAVQPPELQLQAPGLLGLPLAGTSNFAGQLPGPWVGPALLDDASAGMQGARHERFNGLPTVDFRNSNNKHLREFPSESHYHRNSISPARTLLRDHSPSNNNHFSLLSTDQQQQQLRPHFPPSNQSSGFMATAASAAAGAATRNSPGEISSPKPTSTAFFLFGQSIDPSNTSNTSNMSRSKQQQLAPGHSSSDSPVHNGQRRSPTSNSSSDTITTENKERSGVFLPARNSGSGNSEVGTDGKPNDSTHPAVSSSGGSEIGSLKWFKDQGSDRERASSEGTSLCKVFRDGEEVGRTLDMSCFTSYEELYSRLETIFGVSQLHFQDRAVYRDAQGSTKHVGDEPYRSFMQTVRRLTILPDAVSGSPL